MNELIQQVLHYTTLPEAAGLLCVTVFMLGERRRGRMMFWGLSFSVSSCLLLKEFFKVPRPWWPDVSTAPYLAEGGYALPCLHTMLAAAMLSMLALTSGHKIVRFLCAAGICITAGWRTASGLQSIPDVLTGAAAGLAAAFLLCPVSYRRQASDAGNSGTHRSLLIAVQAVILLAGSAAAVLFHDGWGSGTGLTAILLSILEKPFRKAETGRTAFGKIYGTLFAAGIYTGLIIFLPFLVEWLITPLWPGQTLIVLTVTLVPCLLRLFPIF